MPPTLALGRMVALSMNEVSKSLLTAGLYFAFSGPVSEYFKENLYLCECDADVQGVRREA